MQNSLSQAHHKKIDGHAPGLSGLELNAYIAAGVYSDHECFTYENALEKLQKAAALAVVGLLFVWRVARRIHRHQKKRK